ncbi:MAG: TRAP transporter substrate-binding protein [Deferrisomatales bacterium]
MNRWIRTFAGLALLLGAALPRGAAGQTLKIATLAPEGTAWMTEIRAGAQEVEARTEGRVRMRFYPGGVMGNDRTVLRKIRAGQLHGGAFTTTSLSGIYRDVGIYGLPFLFQSLDEVDYVRGHMDPLLRRGLAAGGMIALGMSEGGFAYLLSAEPVERVADLRQRKVWAPEGDEVSRLALKAAGVAPVTLPLADVYTGLQTGLIDTVGTTPAGAIALQWHTKVKYLTDVPLFYVMGVLAVDRKAFERLEPEDRKVVQEVMGRVFERMDRLNRQSNEQARAALRRHGITFLAPASDAELARWRAIADETVAEIAARGVYSREMLDTLLGHLKAYRAKKTADAR